MSKQKQWWIQVQRTRLKLQVAVSNTLFSTLNPGDLAEVLDNLKREHFIRQKKDTSVVPVGPHTHGILLAGGTHT